jgi:hypothetical protein
MTTEYVASSLQDIDGIVTFNRGPDGEKVMTNLPVYSGDTVTVPSDDMEAMTDCCLDTFRDWNVDTLREQVILADSL